MKTSLKKIFYLQIFSFFLIIFSISIITLYILERKNLLDTVLIAFNDELKLAANEVNYQIKINEENVKAISSRTMIRNELYKWYKGEISLKDIRDYTTLKYADGASVYENILFAIRYDCNSNKIASYQENLMNINPDFGKKLKIIKKENNEYVCLRNDIIYKGSTIGFDYAAFNISTIMNDSYRNLKHLELLDSAIKRTKLKSYANSVEVGKTGIFLYAELNQSIISETIENNIIIILFHGMLLFLLLIFVSYFTILKSIRKLIIKLEEMNKVIFRQEKDLALGQITGGIAHNLNNILMGIVGSTELLSSIDESSEKTKYLLNIIREKSMNAASIISQLSDFNRQRYIQFTDQNLMKLLKKIILKNKDNKYISIISEKKNNGNECIVQTDENYLKLIINNLVKNAIEAHCTKIIIEVYNQNEKQNRICQICSLPIEGDWICLSVKDDGDGIPPEVRVEKLFEPFFSLKGDGSAGLGLSQVSGIIKQHKGHIYTERNVEKGMTCKVYFPVPST